MQFWLKILGAAALLHLTPTLSQAAPKKAIASPALQQEFAGFIGTFRAALKANDSAAVAGMTRLPFMNDDSIRDATQFREKVYKRNFTEKNRACIQRGKPLYSRDGENNDSYAIFCGQNIFTFTKMAGGFLFTDIDAND
jgi:hypothetical protein